MVREIVVLWGPVCGFVLCPGDGDVQGGERAVFDVQPVVFPVCFLERGLAAEDAAAGLGCWAAR